MSLKAGRVGVNPADVDPIDGHINPSSLEGYTKEEADAKFETQEAAAALQPIRLAVPVVMLDGSKLTVEDALQGLNSELTDVIKSVESACTDIITDATVSGTLGNHIIKKNNIVQLTLSLDGVVADANATLAVIPAGYRPKYLFMAPDSAVISGRNYKINTNGTIVCGSALTGGQYVRICVVYFTS